MESRENPFKEECLVAWSRNAMSGILVYEIMPIRFIRNQKMLLISLALLLFASCLVVGLGLSVLFSNRLKKPVALFDRTGEENRKRRFFRESTA